MNTLGRFTLVGLLAATVALLAVQAVGADEQGSGEARSLAGEEFLVQDVTLSFDCDPSRISTVDFSASGPATGPYPGTFTAQGTVTIDRQTLPGPRPTLVAGPLLTLGETFSITSVAGNVTGTKTLPAGLPFDTSQGECEHVTGFATGPIADASGTVVDLFSEPTYDATIQESDDTFHDQGDASFSVSELNLDGTCVTGSCHYRLASFDEGFLQSTAPPEDDDSQGEDETP